VGRGMRQGYQLRRRGVRGRAGGLAFASSPACMGWRDDAGACGSKGRELRDTDCCTSLHRVGSASQAVPWQRCNEISCGANVLGTATPPSLAGLSSWPSFQTPPPPPLPGPRHRSYDEGCVMVKLGREEPVASMDASGKIIWARHNEVQTVNVKSLGDAEEVRTAARVPSRAATPLGGGGLAWFSSAPRQATPAACHTRAYFLSHPGPCCLLTSLLC
jgi:hypothetical protein